MIETRYILMKTIERSGFNQVLKQLGESYNKNVTSSITQVYWQVLRYHTSNDIRNAIYKHISDKQYDSFFPKPINLLDWINNQLQICALDAWDKVTLAIEQVGAYDSVAFDDPVIHIGIKKLGGWVYFCSRTQDQLLELMSIFLTTYNKIILCHIDTYPTHLPGLIEITNQYQHLDLPDPKFIGNLNIAKQVSQGKFKIHQVIHHESN